MSQIGGKPAVRKLKGKVLAVEKTGETIRKEDEVWEKRVFTLELTRFSNRSPGVEMPASLKTKRVKIVRYCLYDWHYTSGMEMTIEPEETEVIIKSS